MFFHITLQTSLNPPLNYILSFFICVFTRVFFIMTQHIKCSIIIIMCSTSLMRRCVMWFWPFVRTRLTTDWSTTAWRPWGKTSTTRTNLDSNSAWALNWPCGSRSLVLVNHEPHAWNSRIVTVASLCMESELDAGLVIAVACCLLDKLLGVHCPEVCRTWIQPSNLHGPFAYVLKSRVCEVT